MSVSAETGLKGKQGVENGLAGYSKCGSSRTLLMSPPADGSFCWEGREKKRGKLAQRRDGQEGSSLVMVYSLFLFEGG